MPQVSKPSPGLFSDLPCRKLLPLRQVGTKQKGPPRSEHPVGSWPWRPGFRRLPSNLLNSLQLASVEFSFFCASSQVNFSALMGRCASLRLRCVTGGRSVWTSLMKSTVSGLTRAASFAVLTGAAAFQKNLCVMEKENARMARMRSAVVGTFLAALLS